MKFSFKGAATVALTAVLALTATTSAQASTTTLPSGEHIYVYDNAGTGSFVDVDGVTGADTPAVTGTLTNVYPYAVAYNPVDHKVYWVKYYSVANGGTELFATDLTTGVATSKGRITDGTTAQATMRLAVTKTGKAFFFTIASGATQLYSLNLATGRATFVATLTGAGTNSRYISYNPADDKLYITFSNVGNLGSVTQSGVFTDLGANPTHTNLNTFFFDSSGRFWTTGSGRILKQADVATWSTTGLEDVTTSALSNTVNASHGFTKYVVPAAPSSGGSSQPTLPNTGENLDVAWEFSALALFLIVAGLVATRVKRRKN